MLMGDVIMSLHHNISLRIHLVMRDYYSGINILVFEDDQILVNTNGVLFNTYEQCLKNLLYSQCMKHKTQHNFVVVNRHYNQSEDKTLDDRYLSNPNAFPEYGWIIIVTRPDHSKQLIKAPFSVTNYNQAKREMFQRITHLYEIANHSLKHGEYKSQHNICKMEFHVTLTFTVAG